MEKQRINWVSRDSFMRTAINMIEATDIALDIGTGIVPHGYINTFIYICCEPFDEYVEVLKKKTKKAEDRIFVILNMDWEQALNKFKPDSVDSVFLIDVIEHMDKETGKRLLKRTELIARKQIVIFTPLGYVEQELLEGGKDAWGLNGASFQEHKSGWLPEDFDGSWNVVACKDYHMKNNVGKLLEEPFGAIWAFKSMDKDAPENPMELNRLDV